MDSKTREQLIIVVNCVILWKSRMLVIYMINVGMLRKYLRNNTLFVEILFVIKTNKDTI